ncbi:unnamed protein product [Clonostachys rosea]|uniref:Prion-inhibition and propagation HeLo domain-containing protein n=1 Tax=Bionectria ochroleuca TaxID=29856 RepID=A0ABY6UEI4_BIOOC|nr:unnamed protein product [Clonostachys rosea]
MPPEKLGVVPDAMAEASSLAVGVVGLLGLASSIVEMHDHRVAASKLSVTALRFTRWKTCAFPQGEYRQV